MLFNSFIFLLYFAVVYGGYLVLRHRAQNLWLLAASYLFYGWWDWRFLFLIFLTSCVDFVCSNKIAASSENADRKKWMLLSVCFNLTILGFFKYFNFFADSFVRLLNLLGMDANPILLNIVLPVGISFYTFQSMSYTIDAYRNQLVPTRRLTDYLLFVSFFPQLVAGPIERASHLLPQVEKPRTIRYEEFREGAWLILLGYFKKVVIADNLAVIANEVFNNPGDYQGLAVLFGVYAFAFQIYGDFSGYSDIARGLGKIMGFDLMYNFKMPYFATNPQEFWRRWHISLSTWLRDYLYVSLGGNRDGSVRTYRNLFLTMLLGGLWHGAAWHFVLWGVFHGTLLIIHRLFLAFSPPVQGSRALYLFKLVAFFHITCVGWVLFRINVVEDFQTLLYGLLTPGLVSWTWVSAFAVLLWPLLLVDYLQERRKDMHAVKSLPRPVRAGVYAILFTYILLFAKLGAHDFIYFQF